MATCDAVSNFIQRVLAVPQAAGSIVESINGTANIGAGAATTVAPANTSRRFLQLVNDTGVDLRISFGSAAVATDALFPDGSVWKVEPDSLGSIFTGLVSVWNAGGAVTMTVLELEVA